MISIAPHRTALTRNDVSRPVRILYDQLLRDGESVFDYGCGRGYDVEFLQSVGIDAAGWDPAHASDHAKRQADLVNLGYVVNVIADQAIRAKVLNDAWSYAGRALVVAARLTNEKRTLSRAKPYGDGYLTGHQTFQRFYQQGELRAWIEAVLGTEAHAAAPGVFVVFRDEADAIRFRARRRRRRVAVRQSRRDATYDAHREVLDQLHEWFMDRGRLPRQDEAPDLLRQLGDTVGTPKQAMLVLRHVHDDAVYDEVAQVRADETLIDLALAKLQRRPKFSGLPSEIQYNVKEFFGSYKAACEQADRLLFSAGDLDTVTGQANASLVGKRTPSALYVHETALDDLAPVLRVYEGCARWLSGDIPDANLVKLGTDKPKVSYLSYPDFDDDPHPALHAAAFVRLGALDVDFRDYRDSHNPPILHRKEEFVTSDYPRFDTFKRFTEQEERYGLFEVDPRTIGNRDGWERVLADAGVELRGHRVVTRQA